MTKAQALDLIQENWDTAQEIFKENPSENPVDKAYRRGYFQALINIRNAIRFEKE